jgi:transposase
MMGQRQVDQAALFYEFSLERHVPAAHLLRSIDRFVDLSDVRSHVAPFYSCTGRPSIDPELLVRMLLVGYCYGIRSERRLCEEVHLNLAYRWFCRLGLDGEVPGRSTFSKNRHAASAIAICCQSCSRRWSSAAWQKGWSMELPLRSMPA